MKLAFSSLSCPSCTVDEIIQFALKYGFQGVELRTVQSTIDLWDLEDFSMEALPETRRRFENAGLEVVVVGTSISFAKEEPGWRSRQLELLEKFCVIAQGLGCPYLRVFGGPIPSGSTYEAVLERDIDGYRQAVETAASYGVTLLFETHDDFSTSAALLPLLEAVGSRAGVIWDILHPYRFGEPMETTCQNLLPYLRHVHVKDSSRYSGEGFDIILPGQGTVPIREALSLLKDCGYEGYLCFEWEKHWHPEIQEAELALPEYVNYMRRYAGELLHEQA